MDGKSRLHVVCDGQYKCLGLDVTVVSVPAHDQAYTLCETGIGK
jgi:hypothetical protein